MEAHAVTSPHLPFRTTRIIAILAMTLLGLVACSRILPDWIGKFFGPPSVELKEAYAPSEESEVLTFDHSKFDHLLRSYVDADGYVDYSGLNDESGELDAYIDTIVHAPFEALGRDEKLALLINAYNAFTLRLILDYWDGGELKSIKDIPSDKRWDDARWNIAGHVWSLNQIEHEQIRPKFEEPRIHFALVCAAYSCPPLRTEAYTGAKLEEQLEDQALYSHQHDRWFEFDPASDTLKLTMLYHPAWYGGDFDQVADSVVAYAARYSESLRIALEQGREPAIEWIAYRWDLNRQP